MSAPTRRTVLAAGIGAAMLGPAAWVRAAPGLAEFRRVGSAFGTTVSMLVLHQDAGVAERALDAAFAEVRSVERAASLFDLASDISRLNRDGFIARPDARLVELLRLSREATALTGGAFDITVQPYWPAWADATANGSRPSANRLATARAAIDPTAITADADGIRFGRVGMGITLNGIARGYATDRVIALLRRAGIEHALIDTDGFGALGHRDGQPWSVAIAHPRHPGAFLGTITPFAGFLSTSGDYASSFSPDFRDNHIFVPATGYSPTELASATVIAPSGAMADALSTGAMVLGAGATLRLVARIEGAACVLVTKDGQVRVSKGAPFARNPT